MNICVLTSSYPINDIDIAAPFVRPFVQEIEKFGHRACVFTPARRGAPVGWDESATVYRFDYLVADNSLVGLRFTSPIDLMRMASLLWNGERQLLRLIEERQIATCLALWAVPSGYWAWRAKRVLGIPYAVWALGSDLNAWAHYPLTRTVVRRVLIDADTLFADGFDLCRKARQLADKECEFLSSARTLSLEQRSAVDLDSRQVHFLFIGRWEKVKGVDVLLQALELLEREIGHDRLAAHILGGGSLESWMRRFISDHCLADMVQLVPNVSLPTLIGYLIAADCIVIPSRSESIPLVFSEALQANLPLIVSDVGDMGVLVRDYEVGWVIPPDNPMALKQAMRRFLEEGYQPSLRREKLLSLMDLRTSASRYSEVIGRMEAQRVRS